MLVTYAEFEKFCYGGTLTSIGPKMTLKKHFLASPTLDLGQTKLFYYGISQYPQGI